MRVIPIDSVFRSMYQKKRYAFGLRYDTPYVVDKETGERIPFETVAEAFEAQKVLNDPQDIRIAV